MRSDLATTVRSVTDRLVGRVRGRRSTAPTTTDAVEIPVSLTTRRPGGHTVATPSGTWGESGSACYAPHGSMYFDQRGMVRACCQNTGVYLGDTSRQSLREIWESAEAEQMRTALEEGDYSAGCDFCEWQVREGNDDIVFARNFDDLRAEERRPRWPLQMEFSLTNTCNLQCVMCNGDLSSAIRGRREKRAPLPAAYGEEFFQQLREFLPHLHEAKFLGGEPFLGREPLRVLEMLAELDDPPAVSITTNGTVLTPAVERIVTRLQPSIVISIDGASVETFDAIRLGAHFPTVIEHLDRFRSMLGPGKVTITHCLMRSNWHEFAQLLALAEERDLFVGVNIVRFPAEHSLYHLSTEELEPIVEQLEATDVALSGARLDAWTNQLASLAHRLEVVRRDDPTLGPVHGLPGASHGPSNGPPNVSSRWPWLPFPEEAPDVPTPSLPMPEGAVASFVVDTAGVMSFQRVDDGLPVELTGLEGQHIGALITRMEDRYGLPDRWIQAPRLRPDHDDITWVWPCADPDGDLEIELIMVARRDEAGALTGGQSRIQTITRRPGSPWPAWAALGEP